MNSNTFMCRCCLNKDCEVKNLFTEIDENFNLTFYEEFEEITNVQINEKIDSIQHICLICLEVLKISFRFRKQCLQSELNLKEEFKTELIEGYMIEDAIIEETQEEIEEETITDEPVIPRRSTGRIRKKKNTYFSDEEETTETNHDFMEDNDQESDEEIPLSEMAIKHEKEEDSDSSVEVKNKKFECQQCKKVYKLKMSLFKHIQNAHSEQSEQSEKKLLCNVCGKTCAQESSLQSHLLQHQGNRPFQCEHCEKSYFTKNGLHSHSYIHMPEKRPKASFLCSTCGKGFTTNQRLKIHTYVHTGERNHQCEICAKSFATEFRLKSHKRIHTGERPYQCQTCGLRFAQGNALKCHKRIHTGEKPYECKVCGKSFSQNTILKTHMTLHTGKTVKCPDCDKKFSRASYLILHRREHTGEKPYACDRCPNRYKQKSHLDRHMDTHNGIKHKCEICSKEYSKQWSLKMHMFTHTTERPFKCTECPLSFIRKDKYKTHLRCIHGRTLEDVKPIMLLTENPEIEYEIETIEEHQPTTTQVVIFTLDDPPTIIEMQQIQQ